MLDAVRSAGAPCAVVVVIAQMLPQRWSGMGISRTDPLGGHDPYSASKAGSELVVDVYRSSYFPVDRIGSHGV